MPTLLPASRGPEPRARHLLAVPTPVAAGAPPTPARWQRRWLLWIVAADLMSALVGSALGYVLRFGATAGTGVTFRAAAVLPLFWLTTVWTGRGYEWRYLEVGSEEFCRVWNAGLRLLAFVAVVSLALRLDLARSVVGVALPVTVLSSLGLRAGIRRALHRRQRGGRDVHRVLVLGRASTVSEFCERLVAHQGYRIAGVCTEQDGDVAVGEHVVPRVGGVEDVLTAVHSAGADTVAVAGDTGLFRDEIRRLGWQLEGSDVDLIFGTDLVEVAGPRIHVRPIQGMPLLHVEEPEFRGPRRVLKATYDRGLSVLALIMLTPVFGAIALALRLESPGPVFFRQTRVGLAGGTFTLWKFRSMVLDAETRLAGLQDVNEHEGVLFKIRLDPRITRVGQFLRKWSLDELPQLFNVAAGQMSLVGPRPPLPSEVANYDSTTQRRLLVKPGLTGLWQVSGRSDLSWEQSVRLDLSYVENWTPLLDLMILVRTLRVVIRRTGAY